MQADGLGSPLVTTECPRLTLRRGRMAGIKAAGQSGPERDGAVCFRSIGDSTPRLADAF